MTTIVDPKTKTAVTWRAVLLQAADMVRVYGHTRECPERQPDSPVCPVIAMARAQRALGCDDSIFRKALAVVTAEIGGADDGTCVVIWNRRQNAASVIAMFERAALSPHSSAMGTER